MPTAAKPIRYLKDREPQKSYPIPHAYIVHINIWELIPPPLRFAAPRQALQNSFTSAQKATKKRYRRKT